MQAQALPVLTPYQRIGGEAALRQLTRRFYEIMEQRGDRHNLHNR